MAAKKNTSGKYRKVDPDEYDRYEEQFLEKGGGGKGAGGKGKKTLQALKRQQRAGSLSQRREELEDALVIVLDGFPDFEDQDSKEKYLAEYTAWIQGNLARMGPLDPSQIELSFSKAKGPGGQNVNKRETKVALLHKLTGIRVVNDETRSQIRNRELALDQLKKQLENHLLDWKMYLGGNQPLDISLVKDLMDRNN